MPHSPRWKKRGLCAFACFGLAASAFLLWKPKVPESAVAPYFNGIFPPDAPSSSPTWEAVNAFPNLGFTDPMWIAEIPDTGRMLVVEKGGKLKCFPNESGAAAAQVVTALDLGPQLQVSEDQGVYQVAFHPEFGKPGSAHAAELFITYSHRPQVTGAQPDQSMWRLSRFQWQAASGTIDPASESVLIQQYDPNRWHNGGAMAFDNSGCLLFTCGDGGGTDDQFGQSQRLDGGFFGGVFRIDVDRDTARSHAIRRQPGEPPGKPVAFPASFSRDYLVPADNPWLDPAGGNLEETYALGLRSPHSAYYDPSTGGLWVGDVGRIDSEELNLVAKGANLQWPYLEGKVPGPKLRGAPLGIETPPYYAYGRSTGGCIIGGMRYRGAKWAAELGGKVIFGDNLAGSIHALTADPVEGPPFASQILDGFGAGIYSGLANICTDSAGEIYLVKLNGKGEAGGSIRKLVPGKPLPEPPALLSATGIFKDTARMIPAPSMVPYEVASPSWSDGAGKRRWIVLPNDGKRDTPQEKIAWSAEGNWSFPAGTLFVKHLEIALDERDPSRMKRLETRVIVCTPNGGKYGLTYRWNDAGTDAHLLAEGAEEPLTLTRADGSTEARNWQYPSRADCARCHTNAAGQALGLRTHQLNRMVASSLGDAEVNQLARFNSEGMFHPALGVPDLTKAPAARAPDDESAPLEHRVRSYLDTNCAHCHQPAGIVPHFDARLQTPLREQGIIDAAIKGQYPLPGGSYLKPGHPELSALYVRTASEQPGIAMPPLGRHALDRQGIALLEKYIDSLPEHTDVAASAGGPARCSIAAPRHVGVEAIPVTIVFDAEVGGFEAGDLEVTGGRVTSLRGKGYHYIAMVEADAGEVVVSVPRDRIAGDCGNLPSNKLVISTARANPVSTAQR